MSDAAPVSLSSSVAATTFQHSRCYTNLGTSPLREACKTTSSTILTPCATTLTVFSTTTTTPVPITSLITSITTLTFTAPTVTDTATLTNTATATFLTTSISVETSTATATIATASTSTVEAPASFLPVQSSLPGATYDGSFGADPVVKREIDDLELYERSAEGIFGQGKKGWPQKVTCYHWRPSSKCSTNTIVSTVTKTAATPTMFATTTQTSTSTVYPSATTTTTVATTTTNTQVATSISISTTTTQFTTATGTTTVYAACATNNFADRYNGLQFFGMQNLDVSVLDTAEASSAYECCVAALTDPNGAATVWYFDDTIDDSCYIEHLDGSGFPQAASQWTAEIGMSGMAIPVVVGNGLSGEINNVA